MKPIHLGILLLLVLAGCKGDDGSDGQIYIQLQADMTIRTSDYALACVIASDSETLCLGYINGLEVTDASQFDSSLTMTSYGATNGPYDGGTRTWCITTDANTDCLSDRSGEVHLTAASGDSGSTGFPAGSDGSDGENRTWVVSLTNSGASESY